MKRIINILVSIVFLASFIGVQVNTHYSNGELFSIGIFHEATSCCDDIESCNSENHYLSCCEKQIPKSNSCENFTSFFKINDVFASEQLVLPKVNSLELFVIAAISVTSNLSDSNKNQFIHYYSPPILYCDNLQAISGVFLC